jgi:hypothetical protein
MCPWFDTLFFVFSSLAWWMSLVSWMGDIADTPYHFCVPSPVRFGNWNADIPLMLQLFPQGILDAATSYFSPFLPITAFLSFSYTYPVCFRFFSRVVLYGFFGRI